MRRHRNAKIVATLGPASSSKERIRALFDAGADVFRLNFSHGSREEHKQHYKAIRAIEREVGRAIGVIVDLQGPKLRIGAFGEGSVTLAAGSIFSLDIEDRPGDQRRVSLPHPVVFQNLTPGSKILLDDGKVQLEVESCGGSYARTRVVVGGSLSDHKGISIAGAVLPLPALTSKDRDDLAYGLELGADWIALSFVQRPEDVEELRKIVAGRAGVIAKLEKPAAIRHLDSIVALSDAIMIARGDLGVEMPPEHIPPIQRRIIRSCRRVGKPSIVATQMLESMVHAPTPTRAEASDVASAVYLGADAVMLSAESAVGRFPVEAVAMMERVISAAENDRDSSLAMTDAIRTEATTIPEAICASMKHISELLPIAAIVTYTVSGSTSLRAARERPATSILSMAANLEIARRLTLAWGLHSVQASAFSSLDEMSAYARQTALREEFATDGDTIIIAAGTPVGVSKTTNMLEILKV
jgi:pyruvate kinase